MFQSRITPPRPDIFTGEAKAGEASAAVGRRLLGFLQQLERFLHRQYTAAGATPDEETYCCDALLYVGGEALGVALDYEAGEAERGLTVTWPGLRASLVRYYNPPVSAYAMTSKMRKVKQLPTDSVNEYYQRFMDLHRDFATAGLAGRDQSVNLFVEGLLPHLQPSVHLHLMENDSLHGIERHEATRALAKVREVAILKEEYLPLLAQATHASQNQIKATVEQPRPRSFYQKPSGIAPTRPPSTAALPATTGNSSDRVNIPKVLWQARRLAGVCFRCNSNKHAIGGCNQPVNLHPAPPPRSATRVNTMTALQSCTYAEALAGLDSDDDKNSDEKNQGAQ